MINLAFVVTFIFFAVDPKEEIIVQPPLSYSYLNLAWFLQQFSILGISVIGYLSSQSYATAFVCTIFGCILISLQLNKLNHEMKNQLNNYRNKLAVMTVFGEFTAEHQKLRNKLRRQNHMCGLLEEEIGRLHGDAKRLTKNMERMEKLLTAS